MGILITRFNSVQPYMAQQVSWIYQQIEFMIDLPTPLFLCIYQSKLDEISFLLFLLLRFFLQSAYSTILSPASS